VREVGLDLLERERNELVLGHVPEVPEPADDRPDSRRPLIGVDLLAVASEEETKTLLDGSSRALLDRHHVEVVTKLWSLTDHLQLHREQVWETGDADACHFLGWHEASLPIRVQELKLRSEPEAVEGSLVPSGYLKEGDLAQPGRKFAEIDRVWFSAVEEVEIVASAVLKVDGKGSSADEVERLGKDGRDRLPRPPRLRRKRRSQPIRKRLAPRLPVPGYAPAGEPAGRGRAPRRLCARPPVRDS
jgi:hypothetical protein